jgi:uncharacterized protein (UPF0261 family)
MRASKREMINLAKIVAEKLNMTKGPTTIVIPEKGWSEYDIVGGVVCVDNKGNPLKKPWYDPMTNEAFTKTLEKNLDKSNSNIKLIKVEAHINDPAFASTVAEEMEKIVNT